jgi:hypothetical protein
MATCANDDASIASCAGGAMQIGAYIFFNIADRWVYIVLRCGQADNYVAPLRIKALYYLSANRR